MAGNWLRCHVVQLAEEACGTACDDAMWRHITSDDAPGANDRVVTDMNAGKDHRFRADPNVVLDDDGPRWWKFIVPDDVVLTVVHDEGVVTEEAVGSDLDR
jgi:hypothetical protein